MRCFLLALVLLVSTPAFAVDDDQLSEMARKRFLTFTDIKAIQPRASDFLPISSVSDWTMFYPTTVCQFQIDGAANKSGESRFIVTCPRFAYAKSAVTFRFETRSNTPQTLYLTSVLSDTVDVSHFEYEQFLEKPLTYYGSFQSAMQRDVSLAFLVNERLDESGTLLALLGLLRDDGGYRCFTISNVDTKMSIYCELWQTQKRPFVMDLFDLDKQVVLAGIRTEPNGKPLTSRKMVEFLRRAMNMAPSRKR